MGDTKTQYVPAATSEASSGPESASVKHVSNISVIIPAYNEKLNLPHALDSTVGWADAVYVVDSESTDCTRELAAQRGAKVVVQSWLGYAQQKNWALDNLPIDTDWVFILDADESITPELRNELIQIARKPLATVPEAGFYVNRLTHFMGSPIRHAGFFPSYNLRFFKRGRARYEPRDVHEHMVVDGSTRRLKHLMHHEDRRGLEHFIAKHNRYSTLESRELIRDRHRLQGELAERLERGIALRRWLKRKLLPRLPLTGLWRFIYMYVFRLGFLDGPTGLRFCLLLSTYDFFISLKLTELRLAGAAKNIAIADAPVPLGLAQPEGTMRSNLMPVGDAHQATADKQNKTIESPDVIPPKEPEPAESPRPRPVERRKISGSSIVKRLNRHACGAFLRRDVATSSHPPVSIIVLASNEEVNITPCLESCSWCDDVHVLDSGSTDRTCEIAREMGAQVHVNPFKSFGQQRNWAIDHIDTKYRWQFQLDADERITPALVEEMAKRFTADEESVDGVTAYQNPSMLMFMGRWVRYAAEYPVYQVRLLDKTQCRFEDYGHGQREVNKGATGIMVQPYLHYNFSKGVEDWIDKHNRYSQLEAAQAHAEAHLGWRAACRNAFLGGSIKRRRVLKRLSYRVPLRPSFIFAYQLILRFGFLDGRAGWNYMRLRSIYESMIAVQLSLLRKAARQHGRKGDR